MVQTSFWNILSTLIVHLANEQKDLQDKSIVFPPYTNI